MVSEVITNIGVFINKEKLFYHEGGPTTFDVPSCKLCILMNKNCIFGVAVLLLCFVSCTKDKYYATDELVEVDFPEYPDSISGKPISVGINKDLYAACNYKDLVIYFSYSSPLVHVMNAKNDSVIAEFGEVGHSKVEFEEIPNSCYFRKNQKGDLIMCFRESLNTKRINLTSTLSQSKCVLEKNVKNIHVGMNLSTFWLTDSNRVEYLPYGFEGDARDYVNSASRIDVYKGKECKSYSAYPSILSNENGIDNELYMACLEMSPDLTKCIELPFFQDRFTIVDLKKGKTIGVKPKKESYDYFESLHSLSKEDVRSKLKLQIVNYALSDSYIFIWHNGKISITDPDAEEQIPNNPEMRIFDWSGNFITSVILKGKIICFTYNEVANAIYAVDVEGNTVRYDLSKIL